LNGFSQNNTIGVSVGSSFSKIGHARTHGTVHYKFGCTAAVDYQHAFGRFILAGGVDYTQKGLNDELEYGYEGGRTIKGLVRYTFDYIGVSVKGGVRYGDRLFGNTMIGLNPSYLLQANHRSGVADGTYVMGFGKNVGKGYMSDISKFDLAVSLETTVGYRIAGRSSLFMTLGYSTGVVHVKAADTFPSESWTNHWITGRVGYQFSF
jgi:hypothetical protein